MTPSPRRSTRSSRVISFAARGTRSADGAEFTADEIVSGTFRNIAGTISALDASAGTITVQDLVSKETRHCENRSGSRSCVKCLRRWRSGSPCA